MLSIADRVLGIHLGLGDLQPLAICHGYSCACQCSQCLERERDRPAGPAPQPWEAKAA